MLYRCRTATQKFIYLFISNKKSYHYSRWAIGKDVTFMIGKFMITFMVTFMIGKFEK